MTDDTRLALQNAIQDFHDALSEAFAPLLEEVQSWVKQILDNIDVVFQPSPKKPRPPRYQRCNTYRYTIDKRSNIRQYSYYRR